MLWPIPLFFVVVGKGRVYFMTLAMCRLTVSQSHACNMSTKVVLYLLPLLGQCLFHFPTGKKANGYYLRTTSDR